MANSFFVKVKQEKSSATRKYQSKIKTNVFWQLKINKKSLATPTVKIIVSFEQSNP